MELLSIGAEFDLLHFQTTLLYKINNWGKHGISTDLFSYKWNVELVEMVWWLIS